MRESHPSPPKDLVRITLSVLVIGLLILACLWVLEPFVAATVWATMVVVATWPMMLGAQRRLGGRRWAAVLVMTLAFVLVLVLPLVLVASSVSTHAEGIVVAAKGALSQGIPPPPAWVERLPLAGAKLSRQWAEIAASSHEQLAEKAAPYLLAAAEWLVARAGGVGRLGVHLVLTIAIAAILYARGETAALGVRRFARRLAGDRGEGAVVLAGQAIRGVALGVVVTALAQSLGTGIGLAACGIPYAGVLTALTLVLCIAQLGPFLVLAPSVGWLYWSEQPGRATALLVWSLIVVSLDNVLRPALIRRGADLPLILIFAGVLGGLVGFGMIGLFVGPVVLAVTYRLLGSWVAEIDAPPGESELVEAASRRVDPAGSVDEPIAGAPH